MRHGHSRTGPIAGLGLAASLLLAGCDEPDGPAPGGPPTALFDDATAASGPAFVHSSGDRGRRLTPSIMSGGAALFDHDGDGDLDAYLTDGDGPNRLFEQVDGGRFVDATDRSGLGDTGYGMGVAVGDADNDGDLDVYVANLGPDRYYRNEGGGRFVDATAEAGIDVDGWSTSATFVDLDVDGRLDLFVVRYVAFDAARRCTDPAGRDEFCGPEVFPPLHDVLLSNVGDGRFEDVSTSSGVAGASAAGLGVVAEDLDDDGVPELYVANDAYANQLWVRGADGRLEDRALTLGAAYNLHGQPEAGMGVVAADLDGDARVDLFVTHLSEESNTYYRNLGAGRGFADATGQAGLAAPSMAHTGFGVAALDLELDGDLDLLVANGRVTRAAPRPDAVPPAPWAAYAEPNLIFVNDGGGRFASAVDAAFCGAAEISRGLALGDVDRDGDLDVLVANVEGPARLLHNVAPRRGAWLVVDAVDPALGRTALGARVTVHAGDRAVVRTIGGGFGYLSGSEAAAHVGLGAHETYDRIEVRWPGGARERFPGGPAGRRIVVRRGSGTPR